MANKFSSISDENCIIVEFVNESREVSVAFSSWLESKKAVEDLIESKEDVEISWPDNQDIVPANKMKKILQKVKVWKTYAVKVVDCGGKSLLMT